MRFALRIIMRNTATASPGAKDVPLRACGNELFFPFAVFDRQAVHALISPDFFTQIEPQLQKARKFGINSVYLGAETVQSRS